MTHTSIGLTGLRYVQLAVRNLEGARRLYEDRMGMRPVWRSTMGMEQRDGQRSLVFAAGASRIMVSQPLTDTSDAARYLHLHPEGIMTVAFDVRDVSATFSLLTSRRATPVLDVVTHDGHHEFDIATPLGGVQFRLVQARSTSPFAPGMEEVLSSDKPGAIPWIGIDHLTTNTRTMRPVVDWYRDVLGFTHFWDVEFHTAQTPEGQRKPTGSGLRSIVMWDPESGVKLATNEPLRPFFRNSQVELFVTDNRGPGVQHVALAVPSILDAVDALEDKGFHFLPAPDAYYQRLGQRLRDVGWDMDRIREPMEALRKRNILVDGSEEGYMLQIFQQELRQVEGRPDGSPSFFEVIQRAGDRGFGYGNFRALFEAIEASQAGRHS